MVLRPAWPMLVSVREGMAGDNGSAEIRWQLKLSSATGRKRQELEARKKSLTSLACLPNFLQVSIVSGKCIWLTIHLSVTEKNTEGKT